MEHDLKTWPIYFAAIQSGAKTFELRNDDRHFAVGDVLVLREWNPINQTYSGASIRKRVTHLLRHDSEAGCAATFGLKPGYVILSISSPGPTPQQEQQAQSPAVSGEGGKT